MLWATQNRTSPRTLDSSEMYQGRRAVQLHATGSEYSLKHISRFMELPKKLIHTYRWLKPKETQSSIDSRKTDQRHRLPDGSWRINTTKQCNCDNIWDGCLCFLKLSKIFPIDPLMRSVYMPTSSVSNLKADAFSVIVFIRKLVWC